MKLLNGYLLLFLLATPIVHAESITVTTDPWCPYACEDSKEDHLGYMIEIAKTVYKKAGYELKYQPMNFARATTEVRSGKIEAIAGVTSGDKEGLVFSEEMGLSENCFIVLNTEPWVFKGPENLKQISFGAITGYTYNDLIDQYIKENKKNPNQVQLVSGSNPLLANWKKLKANRIKAIIEDRNVFEDFAVNQKLGKDFKYAGCFPGTSIYIGFGEKALKSEKLNLILKTGLAELRKSGELGKILKKYKITNWH